MTLARRQQIDLDATPYYHCHSRCVRRAFLCGVDTLTARDYSHRKQWLVERLAQLTDIFAINLCAYAILSNHYHVVLHVEAARATLWSDAEVIERWHRLFRPKLVELGEIPDAGCLDPEQIATWRKRLANVSWFMRSLNEPIARRANQEDECKGRFWEGRFKCRALLDEPALLACMSYVDLNPIHAGIATTPEQSDYTSVQARIRQPRRKSESAHRPSLLAFADESGAAGPAPATLPGTLADYLTLVDWTGRALRHDKCGAIPADLPPILERLALPPERWLRAIDAYDRGFVFFVGRPAALQQMAHRLRRLWVKGLGLARAAFA